MGVLAYHKTVLSSKMSSLLLEVLDTYRLVKIRLPKRIKHDIFIHMDY